jgi:hypothetical protein
LLIGYKASIQQVFMCHYLALWSICRLWD